MVMFEIVLFSLVLLCGAVILVCKWLVPALAERDPEPWYLDYARSFFPVLLIVFILRGFIAEPFRIPSGSMLPTLEVGDFILVNKYTYGIRLPIVHKKVMGISQPQRGDIMVFRWPRDNKTNYIKRVIGLPGDRVEYRNKQLFINGNRVDRVSVGDYKPTPTGRGIPRVHEMFKQLIPSVNASVGDQVEDVEQIEYSILIDSFESAKINRTFIVPDKRYFVLGDNRDHSLDSRFWEFVPDENVVGRAFFIWFHFNKNNAEGNVKFSRIGGGL